MKSEVKSKEPISVKVRLYRRKVKLGNYETALQEIMCNECGTDLTSWDPHLSSQSLATLHLIFQHGFTPKQAWGAVQRASEIGWANPEFYDLEKAKKRKKGEEKGE